RRAVVRGEEEIEVAVAIEVCQSQAASDFGLIEAAPQGGGAVAETALSGIEKKRRGLGIAHIAANVADGLINVSVGHGEIEPAVKVGVKKRATETETIPGGQANPGLGRYVLEAFARLTVQANHFIIEVCDDDARCARIVEVGHVDTHSSARFAFGVEGSFRLNRGIFEGSVALIPIE